jgi:hypothetical protein
MKTNTKFKNTMDLKEIAASNLKEYTMRNNSIPTKEDIINILGMAALFVRDAFDDNEKSKQEIKKESTSKDLKAVKREAKPKKESKPPMEIMEEIKKFQMELGKVPTMKDITDHKIDIAPLLKTCGGWKTFKQSLTSKDEAIQVVELMHKLNKIPTKDDLEKNNISLDNILVKFGSWSNAKKSMDLEKEYIEMIKGQILKLKETTKITIRACDEADIDTSYLMRKYGSWSESLRKLGIS